MTAQLAVCTECDRAVVVFVTREDELRLMDGSDTCTCGSDAFSVLTGTPPDASR